MAGVQTRALTIRSEEHTSELQSHDNLVCRLRLEKKRTGRRWWSARNRCEGRADRRRDPPPRPAQPLPAPPPARLPRPAFPRPPPPFFFKSRAAPRLLPFSPPGPLPV